MQPNISMETTMRLDGKYAVVTGGGRGIGFAIAKALAREGAGVAIADINADTANAAAAAIGERGGRAVPVAVDVADPASISAMVASVMDAFGRIDILVNNAGVGGKTPFLETSLEEWNRIISINLTGAFLVAQTIAREMVKTGGGKIVNIASLSGQRGVMGGPPMGRQKLALSYSPR
jgi:NAD(P)-dependent dehydrogenase (short-subunit alcohol dehydrogenase family)